MMNPAVEPIAILHNKVPHRIRFAVPLIRNKQTLAELLKQNLLKHAKAKGIYHAEPNIVTGTLLVKYHPAFHGEADVVALVRSTIQQIAEGKIEISQKHKNPRVSRMTPKTYFTRELVVSTIANVIAGVVVAAIAAR
ncbi:HMA2 domain-containing protein [Methylomagnum sp.]